MAPSSTPAPIIQADTAAFKDIVQKLTGAHGSSAHRRRAKVAISRRSSFKLQERRKLPLRDLDIVGLGMESAGNSPTTTRSNALFSPVKGHMTPLGRDSVSTEREETESPLSEEERAIAENGFYLHSSPRKAEPPVLLTLFPLTSPKQEL